MWRPGSGFIEILKEHGLILFVYGALITLIPMIVGYFVATKLMKLSLFNTLGSICGGMTSTPALGTLIRVTGTDDVASAYAATYPGSARVRRAGLPVYRDLLITVRPYMGWEQKPCSHGFASKSMYEQSACE